MEISITDILTKPLLPCTNSPHGYCRFKAKENGQTRCMVHCNIGNFCLKMYPVPIHETFIRNWKYKHKENHD